MIRAVAACFAASVALIGGAGATSAFSPWRSPDVRDLVLRYAAGEHAVAEQSDAFDVASVQRDLARITPELLGTPSLRPDLQRRALAGFAIEVAKVSFWTQLAASEQLLDWTRQRLIQTRTEPNDFDRHWHQAAIALLEAVRDQAALERHADFALRQFPDEPRFILAHAVASEIRATAFIAAESAAPAQRETGIATTRLLAAIARAPVRGEAELRLGYLKLQLALYEPDAAQRPALFESARQQLDTAESHVDEPALLYLSRLFRARALAGLTSRAGEAEGAYRSALEVKPGAQAATMGLATVLFQRGDRAKANSLIDALLKRRAAVDDPWSSYWSVDFRFWDRHIGALRDDLK